jgi:opacity protein-like surface antigen
MRNRSVSDSLCLHSWWHSPKTLGVKAITSLSFFTACLVAPLLAGDPPPVSPATADEADAFGNQKWLGVPYMRFGRMSSDTDLPGYMFGSLSYTHRFSADFDSIPGEVSSDSLTALAPILPINYENFHLIAFGIYNAQSYDTSGPNLLTEDTLSSFYMPVLFLHDISEQWVWGGMVMPGYAGNSFSSDNWSIGTALGVGYAFNSEFLLFGGGYYSYGFNDHFVTPGLAFIWRPDPKWEVSVLPPIGGVSYSINENWMLSLTGQYNTPKWHVKSDSAGPDRDINMRSFQLGLKLEYHLGGLFWTSLTGGYSLGQQLEVKNGSNQTLQKEDINPSPFINAALNLRF